VGGPQEQELVEMNDSLQTSLATDRKTMLNEEKRKIESELAALEVKKLATSDGIQLYYVYDVRPMR
jgi:hypothetical protein